VLQIPIGSTAADTASVASIGPLLTAALSLSRERQSHDCWNTSSNQPTVCYFIVDKFGKLPQPGLEVHSQVKANKGTGPGLEYPSSKAHVATTCNISRPVTKDGPEVHVTEDKAASCKFRKPLQLCAACCLPPFAYPGRSRKHGPASFPKLG